jgi:hypothetical protein
MNPDADQDPGFQCPNIKIFLKSFLAYLDLDPVAMSKWNPPHPVWIRIRHTDLTKLFKIEEKTLA